MKIPGFEGHLWTLILEVTPPNHNCTTSLQLQLRQGSGGEGEWEWGSGTHNWAFQEVFPDGKTSKLMLLAEEVIKQVRCVGGM